MNEKSQVRSVMQKVNGLDFYCELRGKGATIALIPSGEGDCGSFDKVADILANEFTVFTLDMRGMSRSERPANLGPMTAEDLASDVAELIKAFDLAPASVYGCSSGGQCALSIGADYPEVCRNIMVHEAALQNDTPPGAGTEFFKRLVNRLIEIAGSKNAAMVAQRPNNIQDPQAFAALSPEYHERISKNGEVWVDFVLGYADQRTYSAKELANMPPLVFSVGLFSMAWLVEANLQTARRANAEIVWLPCKHFPQVSIPDLLAEHIRKYTKRYL